MFSFCDTMNQPLLKILFVSAVFLNVFAIGEVFAQVNPNPVVKSKNSPFSPNPKKKTDNKLGSAQTPGPGKSGGDLAISQKGINESSESGDPGNGNLENRSVTKKTPDVARKANAASVAPTETYKIGSGDVLFISLQNAPAKESNYFTVLNNGTIDYPLAGEFVPVAGLTSDQIEDVLKEKIKLYENPQLSVKVREYNSHAFTVLGLVEKPGEKSLTREALPLYVVRAEAVVQSKANRVTIKRKDAEAQQVDLKDPKYGEVLIFPGDIVEFGYDEGSVQKTQFYYIGGEIVTGGQKDYIQGITLTQSILASGGLKKSSIKKVVIRRKNTAGLLTSTEYDLKAIKEGKAADPVLQAGDTVEIGN